MGTANQIKSKSCFQCFLQLQASHAVGQFPKIFDKVIHSVSDDIIRAIAAKRDSYKRTIAVVIGLEIVVSSFRKIEEAKSTVWNPRMKNLLFWRNTIATRKAVIQQTQPERRIGSIPQRRKRSCGSFLP